MELPAALLLVALLLRSLVNKLCLFHVFFPLPTSRPSPFGLAVSPLSLIFLSGCFAPRIHQLLLCVSLYITFTVGKILIYGFSLPYALLSFFTLPYFTFSSVWLKCWKSSLKIHSTSLNHYTIVLWFPLASLWSSQDSAATEREREIQDWTEQDYYTGTWNHSLFYTYTYDLLSTSWT